jgi:hypothetical protein
VTGAPSPVVVVHNATASRFEATVDGRLSVVSYHLVDGVMRIHHTGVPADARDAASRPSCARGVRLRRGEQLSRAVVLVCARP